MVVHTYVVGDIHLRDCSGPFMHFLRRLQQQQPARLIILGDLCEYWLETDYYVQRVEAIVASIDSKHGCRIYSRELTRQMIRDVFI